VNNGLIVAYVEVFRNLQKALAIYAAGAEPGEVPVEEKGALVDEARAAVHDLEAFCAERDVDLEALGKLRGFELVAAGKQTVEMLMADDDEKVAFLSRAALLDRLYKAILPDKRANKFSRVRAVAKFLADAIASYTERPDISGVMGQVEQLLDESVAAQEYLISASEAKALFDLATVDWTGLQEAFKQGRPRTPTPSPASSVLARRPSRTWSTGSLGRTSVRPTASSTGDVANRIRTAVQPPQQRLALHP
jgi:type I restriction enzyme R subunit